MLDRYQISLINRRIRIGVSASLVLGLLPVLVFLAPASMAGTTVTATGTNPSVCDQSVTDNTDVSATRLSNGDCVVIFKDTSTVTWTRPAGVTAIAILVVGGGGGGGADGGSGGGGGEVRSSDTFNISSYSSLAITVGKGGAGGMWGGSGDTYRATGSNAGNGTSSTVSSDSNLIVANGGVGGGGWDGSGPAGGVGGSGGSGGTSNSNGQQGGIGPEAKCDTSSVTLGSSPTGNSPYSSITDSTVAYGGGGGGGSAVDSWTVTATDGRAGGGYGSSISGGQGANHRKTLDGTPKDKGASRGGNGVANTGGGGGAGSACNAYGNMYTQIGTAQTWDDISYSATDYIDGAVQRTNGGNGADGVVILSYTPDTTAPTVSSIAASSAAGTYIAGQIISISVNFSETVTVTTASGNPFIYLDTGNSDSGTATYQSGSGTKTLKFFYTVRSGDNTSNVYTSIPSAINLNGGTINDASGNAATLTLAERGNVNSLGYNKVVTLDAAKPITSVAISNTHESGTVVSAVLTTNESLDSVTVYYSTSSNLSGATSCGTATSPANGSTVTCTIPATDATYYFYSRGTDSVGNVEGAPTSADDSIIRDSVAPTVETVTATTSNGAYKVGVTVTITVTFSETVNVTGTPTLLLETGSTDRNAEYASGSGSPTLTFTYTVLSGDTSADLNYQSTNALTGTIVDLASNSATLTLPALNSDRSLGGSKSIEIDTTAPGAPTGLDLAAGSDSGSYNDDNITSDTSLVVSGSAETSSVVQLYVDSVSSGGTCIATSGTFSCTTTSLSAGTKSVTAISTDAAGNSSSASTILTVRIDLTAPTVSSFSSTNSSGSYKTGQTINIRATMSETVTVGSQLTLTLNTGETVTVTSTDTGTVLSGSYVIGSGVNVSALTVNSFTLTVAPKDMAGNEQSSTSVPGSSSNLPGSGTYVVDSTPPAVTEVSSTKSDGSYRAGEVIAVTITFSETVTVTGTPRITLETGDTDTVVNYSTGSGTPTLTFNYTVSAGNTTNKLDYTSTTALALNGGTIVDAAGNAADLALAAPGSAGSLGGNKSLVIDTTPPSQLAPPDLDATSDSGNSDSDNITSDNTPTFTVASGEDSATVRISASKSGASSVTCTASSGSCTFTSLSDGTWTFVVNQIDLAGNTSDSSTSLSVLIDTTAPTVSSFGTTSTTGSYKSGSTVVIRANLSETVTANSQITVLLNSGASVVLTSTESSTTLSGNYVIGSSDTNTSTLAVESFALTVAPIDLAGATMTSTTLPATNIVGSATIRIDTQKPVITGPSGGAGSETSTITVLENQSAVTTFNASETVTWSISGTDAAKFTVDTSTGVMTFKTSPDRESPGDSNADNDYLLTISATDSAGNVETQSVTVTVGNVVETTTVTSLSFTSTPGSNNTYIIGETITVTVVFSDTVTVTGTPRIELVGLANKYAQYISGSNSKTLIFRYTVASGDSDANGLEMIANAIDLNGGSISGVENAANLTSSAVATQSTQKVDGLAPIISTSSPANNEKGVLGTANIVITFNKAVTAGSGNITIKTGATTVETISVTDGTKVTFDTATAKVTINPATTLTAATSYYVLIDSTALKDSSNNYFAGISADNVLAFTVKSNLAITTPSTTTGYLNLAFSLAISASGGSGTKTYAIESGTVQAGLTINSSTGVISGTATETKTVSITVSVTDGVGTKVTTSAFNITISTPTFRQFDNGNIRVGSAAGENSVNSKGNFQQPFYKSTTGTYYKLTYSTYPLNFAFGSGSAAATSTQWNGNAIVQDPVLTNQVIDYSGFIGTSLVTGTTGIKGYGTIITSGNFTFNGVAYLLKNTFVLDTGTSSIRISTEITNVSASSTLTNVSFWAGTQDDWVGSSDGPTKTKGNISGGSFSAIASATTTSRALKITSGSEGVLFYTTFANSNTVWDVCCSFSNSYKKRPTASSITGSGDGSYAIYFNLETMTAGTTKSFTWYYAAGPNASLASVESSLSTLGSDTTAPSITGVTFSSNAGSDNTYKVGDVLSFQVAFSENVNVTGTPRIPIQGLSSKYATYTSGTGTSNLIFSYTIASGDLDADGVALSANTLELNSGSISDPSANNAVLTHSALAASTSHKVDGVLPTLSSSSPADDATGVSANPTFTFTFSEAVSAGSGNITLKASSNGATVEQIPVGDPRITFSGNTVTVTPNSVLASVTSYYINIDATAVLDSAGNAYAGISSSTALNFTSANVSAPTVSNITSSTANGSYKAGASISIQVTFSKIVTVTGTPSLLLETGASDSSAVYTSGSGSSTLTFTYTVGAGNTSADLDYVSVNSLTLSGGTINDASANAANLTLPAPGASGSLGNNKSLIIDTTAPALSTSSPTNGATGVLEDANIVLTFNEAVTASTGTVSLKKVSDNSTIESISANDATKVSISGSTVTINPAATLASATQYYVEVSNTAFVDAALNAYSGTADSNTLRFTSIKNAAVAPTITSQPQSKSTTSGMSFTLQVSAATPDRGTLTYQWYLDGVAISGANTNSYAVNPVTAANAGSYTVVVSNVYNATSESTTSTAAIVTVNGEMSISYSAGISMTYGSSDSKVATVTGGTGTKTYSILKSADNSAVSGISISTSGVITVDSSTAAGTYSMTAKVTDAESATATTSFSVTVAQKSVTVSGSTASNKAYDGGTTATLSFSSASLVGVLSSDAASVTLVTSSASGTFSSAAVGDTKSVTVTGLTLSGAQASNYVLTQPSLTANISKASQTISVTSSSPSRPTSGGTYTPTATASSALTVAISIDTSTASVCSISSGIVTFNTSGTCLIRFNQSGDSSFSAASQASQSIIVGKQTQTLTINSITSKSFGAPAFQASATASSGLVPQFSSSSNSSICTVTLAGVVTVVGVGTCTVLANQGGNAAFSAAAETSTSFAITANLPTAPRIAAVSAGNRTVTVSFTAPQSDGGATIEEYVVTSTPEDKRCTWSSGTLACTVQNLTNGTSYTFVVTAVNSAGTGPQSVTSPSVIPVTAANAVEGLSATPGDGQLLVSWSAPSDLGGGTFTKYQVFKKLASSADWGSAFEITDFATTSHTYTGLTNGSAYDVRVVAITTANATQVTGNTAEIVQIPAQAPTAPRDVTIASPTGSNAVVTWAVPLDNGGFSVDTYTVTATVNGRTVSCSLNAPDATTCLISSFTSGGSNLRVARPSPWDPRPQNASGQQIQVSVTATNRIGTSSPSTSTLTLPTAPGAPTITAVTAANGEMTITWTAPSDNGGSAISGYTASIYRRGSSSVLDNCSTSSTSCAISATGETYEYDFAVYAINAVGNGTSSSLYSPAAPAVATTTTTPSNTTNQSSGGGGGGGPVVINSAPSTPISTPSANSANVASVLGLGTVQVVDGSISIKTELIDQRVISISSADFSLKVKVESPSGDARQINEYQERINIVRSDLFSVEASGLKPNTLTRVWLMSTPYLLGETYTTLSGTLSAKFPIPSGTELGSHTIQLNAVTPDSKYLSYSFAVNVLDKPPAPVLKSLDVSLVYFPGIEPYVEWTSNKEIIRVEIYGNDGSSYVSATSGKSGRLTLNFLKQGVEYTAFAIPFDNVTINTYNGVEVGLPPRAASNLGYRTVGSSIEVSWKNSNDTKRHQVTLINGKERVTFESDMGIIRIPVKDGITYEVQIVAIGVANQKSNAVSLKGVKLGGSTFKVDPIPPSTPKVLKKLTVYIDKKTGKLSSSENKLALTLASLVTKNTLSCKALIDGKSTSKTRSQALSRAKYVCSKLSTTFSAAAGSAGSLGKASRNLSLSKYYRVDIIISSK